MAADSNGHHGVGRNHVVRAALSRLKDIVLKPNMLMGLLF